MDDRALRISVLLAAAHHLSLRGRPPDRPRPARHLLRSTDAWWLQYYPPLVWIPFVIAYFFPFAVDLPMPVRLAGLAIAIASAVFAAWAMWSLGKSYGIRMDLFDGHRLVTEARTGSRAIRCTLGIVSFHVGATIAMESLLLLLITLVYVIPFTLMRIRAEDRVLATGFGDEYRTFAGRVPALVPLHALAVGDSGALERFA